MALFDVVKLIREQLKVAESFEKLKKLSKNDFYGFYKNFLDGDMDLVVGTHNGKFHVSFKR